MTVVSFVGPPTADDWGTSRTWTAGVELCVHDEVVASSFAGDFAVLSGRITEDISRPVHRDAQVALHFPPTPRRTTLAVYNGGGTEITPATLSSSTRSPYIPTEVGDLLDPNGPAVMKVYADFGDERVPLGTFDLASAPVTVDSSGATVEVTAYSFERRLERAGFWEIVKVPDDNPVTLEGSFAVAVARTLISQVMPLVNVRGANNGATVSNISWKPGDNRLTKLNDLLTLAGMEGRFDRSNDFVFESSPAVTDFGHQIPRWTLVDGFNARLSTLHGASRTFSDDDSYNGVVVEGTSHDSASAAPIAYTLWNTNPGSPLYFDPDNPAAYIDASARPKHVTSELVRTDADAAVVAAVELAKVLMIADSAEVTVPANPHLEAGHFARLVTDTLGVDAVYRITRVVHDLAGRPATLALYRYQSV